MFFSFARAALSRQKWLRPSNFAFLAIALLLLSVIAFGDRSALLDQDDYINYFKLTDWDWFIDLWKNSSTTVQFAISAITEELGWRTWVLTLNALGFAPESGVRITVISLNLAMVFALARTRRPVLAICLWAIIPVGLATMGLFQIRQGFAFSIALLFALRWERPVLGALLASLIHTTFAFPAAFLVLASVLRKRGPFISASLTICSAVVLAIASNLLFSSFGGRRVDEYAGVAREFNITYVVALVIYAFVPIAILYRAHVEKIRCVHDAAVDELAVMHLGLIAFLTGAFFVFPFAMSRIGYYAPALIVVMLSEVRPKRPLSLLMLLVVFGVVLYDMGKNYLDGVYDYFL